MAYFLATSIINSGTSIVFNFIRAWLIEQNKLLDLPTRCDISLARGNPYC